MNPELSPSFLLTEYFTLSFPSVCNGTITYECMFKETNMSLNSAMFCWGIPKHDVLWSYWDVPQLALETYYQQESYRLTVEAQQMSLSVVIRFCYNLKRLKRSSTYLARLTTTHRLLETFENKGKGYLFNAKKISFWKLYTGSVHLKDQISILSYETPIVSIRNEVKTLNSKTGFVFKNLLHRRALKVPATDSTTFRIVIYCYHCRPHGTERTLQSSTRASYYKLTLPIRTRRDMRGLFPCARIGIRVSPIDFMKKCFAKISITFRVLPVAEWTVDSNGRVYGYFQERRM